MTETPVSSPAGEALDHSLGLPAPADYEAAVRERNAWVDSAMTFSQGESFYRGIVRQIGEMFGEAARTADDGSVQASVLALRVPELVRAALSAPVPSSDVPARMREAFRAGWKVNAVGTDVHSQEYLDGCEEVDWKEYVAALAPEGDPAPAVGVTVKPLSWRRGGDAAGLGFWYVISIHRNGYVADEMNSRTRLGLHGTEQAARAACQAHFDGKLLSWLPTLAPATHHDQGEPTLNEVSEWDPRGTYRLGDVRAFEGKAYRYISETTQTFGSGNNNLAMSPPYSAFWRHVSSAALSSPVDQGTGVTETGEDQA